MSEQPAPNVSADTAPGTGSASLAPELDSKNGNGENNNDNNANNNANESKTDDKSPEPGDDIKTIVMESNANESKTDDKSPDPGDDIKAMVMESPTAESQAQAPLEEPDIDSLPNPPATYEEAEEVLKISRKRKGILKSMKKVLVAKKERDTAIGLLRGTQDLLDVLPAEDCKFLASNFWIFTLKQLRWVFGEEEGQADAAPTFLRGRLFPKVVERLCLSTGESPGDEINALAESELKKWQTAVQNTDAIAFTRMEERFPLEGPVACLFPAVLQNFFATVPIKTLYGFFSLKKTETSAICELLRAWRQECGLKRIGALPLAKHLLSIAVRIETAISAIPPVDERTQQWMGDPMIVMTGAAKEFLVDDQGILTAAGFLEKRTKALSLVLAGWRDKKGLPPLKGSGKVAMISGWKAAVKDSLEAESEPGRVLHGVNLEALADLEGGIETLDEPSKPEVVVSEPPAKKMKLDANDSTSAPTNTDKSPKESEQKDEPAPSVDRTKLTRETKKQSIAERQANYALNSPLFLEDVLGEEAAEILALSSVKTAYDLFRTTSEPPPGLIKAIKEAYDLKMAKQCKAQLARWCKLLKEQLNELRGISRADETRSPRPKKKIRSSDASVTKGVADEIPSSQTAEHAPTSPFEALSAVTRKFLLTLGITTAEQFLSTRTTDIANKFVTWRSREGMPELKGLGSIASVSGWKAACRKVAKEMGQDNIASLEPKNKSSGPASKEIPVKAGQERLPQKQKKKVAKPPKVKPQPVKKVDKKIDKKLDKKIDKKLVKKTTKNLVTKSIVKTPLRPPVPLLIAKPAPKVPVATEELISGKANKVFTVEGSTSQFQFDLSVRKASTGSESNFFVAFRGTARKSKASLKRIDTVSVAYENPILGTQTSVFPVLSDREASRFLQEGVLDPDAPFQCTRSGCGLLEVNKYGVRPLHNQDLMLLKDEIMNFVLSGDDGQVVTDADVEGYNILVDRAGIGKYRYLFYCKNPLEKGQAVEICFPSAASLLASGRFQESSYVLRHSIDEALQVLSISDLRSLLTYLESEVLERSRFAREMERALQSEDPSSVDDFRSACNCRLRASWMYLRILSRLRKDANEMTMSDHSESLYFGRVALVDDAIKSLPDEHGKALKSAIRAEIKKSILAALEFDNICGSSARSNWCGIARHVFNSFLSDLSAFFAMNEESTVEELKSTLAASLERSLDNELSIDDVEDCIMKAKKNGSGELVSFDAVACESQDADLQFLPPAERPIVMKPPVEVENGSAVISKTWYRKLQYEVATRLVAGVATVVDQSDFPCQDILLCLRQVAEKTLDVKSMNSFRPSFQDKPSLKLPPVDPEGSTHPPSFQFFLGLVWPALSKSGWKLVAGTSADRASFLPPGSRSLMQRQSKLMKQQREKKRADLARKIDNLGLGTLPKLTKRLFVATTAEGEEEDDDDSSESESSSSQGFCVKDILELFCIHLQSGLSEDDTSARDRAKTITETIRNCFDELAPKLTLQTDGDDEVDICSVPTEEKGRKRPSETNGADVFMRFLLLAPTILQQSQSPLQQISDTLEVLQELTAFLTSKSDEIFHKRFRPPMEQYATADKPAPSAIVPRLRHMTDGVESKEGNGTSSNNEMTELVWKDDFGDLTDYVLLVLQQAVPCRANEEDIKRKYRRIHLGFPGLVCRHCMGKGGEGRYFFTSVESLTTAPSVLEKHSLKCPTVPAEVKSGIVLAKAHHSEQRKNLRNGAQQSYFVRLWERLRNSKISSESPALHLLPVNEKSDKNGATTTTTTNKKKTTSAADMPLHEDPGMVLEFTDHVLLLDYLRNTDPWKTNDTVKEALRQYYLCLDYGGRIQNTPSMPKGFCPEWLLPKVMPPPDRHSRQARLPG